MCKIKTHAKIEPPRVRDRSAMSLLQYFKPTNGLPNPRGTLSSHVNSSAIASANREVEKLLSAKKSKKRGRYRVMMMI